MPLFRTANTTSKMSLLILSLHTLCSMPYCEWMTQAPEQLPFQKGTVRNNQARASAGIRGENSNPRWDSLVSQGWHWVAPASRGHAVHAALAGGVGGCWQPLGRAGVLCPRVTLQSSHLNTHSEEQLEKRDCSPLLLTVLLLEPCNSQKAQTRYCSAAFNYLNQQWPISLLKGL